MQDVDQPKDLIDVNEAARIIGVTVGRVRQLLIAEELDGCKLNARAWLVQRSGREVCKAAALNRQAANRHNSLVP